MASKNILDSWKKLKSNVDSFIKNNNFDELQESVKSMIQTAQKDLSSVVDQDLGAIKKKFKKETAQFEKVVDRIMKQEIEKAKKFVDVQKKELSKLQEKLESLVTSAKEKPTKKKAAKKATAKKTAKKATTKKAPTKKTVAATRKKVSKKTVK